MKTSLSYKLIKLFNRHLALLLFLSFICAAVYNVLNPVKYTIAAAVSLLALFIFVIWKRGKNRRRKFEKAIQDIARLNRKTSHLPDFLVK